MKIIKKYANYIASLLVVTMLSNTVLIKASNASAAISVPNTNVSSEEAPVNESNIIGEVTEKREKNIKHFMKEDFTYEAAIYPYAVHFNKNGKWEDIDNTLSEVDDEQGNKVLKNKKNEFSVKFSKNSNSSKLIRLEQGKYELSWNLKDAQKAFASVKVNEDSEVNSIIEKSVEDSIKSDKKYEKLSTEKKNELKKKLVENEKKKNVAKVGSTLTYGEILPMIDLEYKLEGDKLKENIILKEKIDNPKFTFNISSKNLTAKLEADNAITFYDAKDSSVKVFRFQAPFMFDSNGEFSNSVKIDLKEVNGEYILTLTPDIDWLADSSRAYPVTLDPPLVTSPNIQYMG